MIAKTYGKFENSFQATKSLNKAIIAAEQINNSYNRTSALTTITIAQAKFSYWRKAHHTVSKCPGNDCKVESLAHILTAWAEKKNPALINEEEN